jgi:hypothetical protein
MTQNKAKFDFNIGFQEKRQTVSPKIGVNRINS